MLELLGCPDDLRGICFGKMEDRDAGWVFDGEPGFIAGVQAPKFRLARRDERSELADSFNGI